MIVLASIFDSNAKGTSCSHDYTASLHHHSFIFALVPHIINPRRACAGGLRYLSCLFVCLSVCYHLIVDIVRFYGLPKVRAALF